MSIMNYFPYEIGIQQREQSAITLQNLYLDSVVERIKHDNGTISITTPAPPAPVFEIEYPDWDTYGDSIVETMKSNCEHEYVHISMSVGFVCKHCDASETE